MAKKPTRSGSDAFSQYSKGMAELKSLLNQTQSNVSVLTQTVTQLNDQVTWLENIISANAPLAKKLADKMEQMSQTSPQTAPRKKATRNKSDKPSA